MSVHQEKPEPAWLPALEKLVEFAYVETAMVLAISLAWMWRNFVFKPLFQKRLRLLRSIEEDRKIEAILYRILEVVDADRVLLMQFHNGESFTSGKHYVYLSATHEATRAGIACAYPQLQRIPVSHISKTLQLVQDGELHCFCRNSTNDEIIYSHLVKLGVECDCLQMLIFKEDVLGVLCLQYVRQVLPKLDHPHLRELVFELKSCLSSSPSWLRRLLG